MSLAFRSLFIRSIFWCFLYLDQGFFWFVFLNFVFHENLLTSATYHPNHTFLLISIQNLSKTPDSKISFSPQSFLPNLGFNLSQILDISCFIVSKFTPSFINPFVLIKLWHQCKKYDCACSSIEEFLPSQVLPHLSNCCSPHSLFSLGGCWVLVEKSH